MKCSQATALFDEYLNKTIQPADEKQLTEHLKACASCQKQWETYRFFFENASIEEDFLVPSQLNAKIKYSIHQAKNNKKVPFFQNKQLLAGLTACSFLLVGTLWGTSYYQQMKEAHMQPQTPVVEPMVRSVPAPVQQPVEEKNESVEESNTPPVAKQKPNVPKAQPKVTQSEPVSQQQSEAEITESQNDVMTADVTEAPFSAAYGRRNGGAAPAPVSEEPVLLTEDTPEMLYDDSADTQVEQTPANIATITLSKSWQDIILSNAPYTQISETCYQVEVNKQTLEGLIGEPVFCPEETLSFQITFE